MSFEAAADAAIEVLLVVAIAVSTSWSVLTLSTEQRSSSPVAVALVSGAIGLSVVAACAALALVWAARARVDGAAPRAMLGVAFVGFIAGVLTAVPAEWRLAFEPCCVSVFRMQRLAAAQCALAAHVALVALRARLVIRWRPARAAGAPSVMHVRPAGRAGAPAAATAAAAGSELSGVAPSSFPFPRVAAPIEGLPVALLWEAASWALTLGAILTVNWGFVTCSDFVSGCASFHSWAIEWTVFALWPLGSAVATSALAAASRVWGGRACRALECGVPFELTLARALAVGQSAAAGILLAVVAANEGYGTSGAGPLGADLQLGPGIGSLGLHLALAVMRIRDAARVRARTTVVAGTARSRRASRGDVPNEERRA